MTDKITKFRPQTKNVNKHTAYGLRLLEKSLREDGFIDAQTAAADGEIISGSARLEKAVEIFTDKDGVEVEPIIVHSDGTRPVIVIRDDIPNAESARAKRLSVAANKIAQVDFDPDWGLLKDWGAEDAGIKALFSDKEWQEGTGEEKKGGDAEPQIDRAAELQEKWQTESGQLWQLGNHRLLIGDCTVRENVERLMGGERAGACVTDSPYGINREGIENDDPEGLRALFDRCLAVMPIDNGVIINFQSPRLFPVWLDAVRGAGHLFKRALWMYDENDQTKPWHYWLMCSQIAIISTIGKPEWIEAKAHHDCYVIGLSKEWRAGGDDNDFAHASVKPVGVVQDVMAHIGGDYYEPFAGSGTTIIAAQNLSRRCYAMEISEKYGAVILERFATAFPTLKIKRLE